MQYLEGKIMKRGPENHSQVQFPDPLTGLIEEVVKSPEGRYAAKQVIAVVSAAEQLSKGVPPIDVERNAKLVFTRKGTRRALGETLQGTREIFNRKADQEPPSETK